MLTLDQAFEELAKLTAPGKTYTAAQLPALRPVYTAQAHRVGSSAISN